MTTTTTKFNTYKITDANQGDNKIKWSSYFYLYFIKHYCKYNLFYNTIEAHASPHRRVLNE